MSALRQGPSSPVIVLLAAGEGRRFGYIKQLAEVSGETMVRRVARIALRAKLPVVVVTGAHAEQVETALDDLPLRIVRCDAWHHGMGNSLATGVNEVARCFPTASAALICLADQPLLDISLIRSMQKRHAEAPDRLLATDRNGVLGPPVLFPRDCFSDLVALSGPRGARALLDRQASRVEVFASSNDIDVDTPEDLQRAREWIEGAIKKTP
jgi:molybdenum cofactor cytidylyltransferase